MNKYIIILFSLFNCFRRRKALLLSLVVSIPLNSLFTIEVGGHLTEDTTWSPDNNPYLVTSVVYVDQGTTLTIEPGTEVYLNAAFLSRDTYPDYFEFLYNFTVEPIAKMIWVNGRIIAEGTEEDSILFTKIQQDSVDYKWGIIHLSESAELSRFKHCRFEHASQILMNITFQPMGAIAARNSSIIDSCYFYNNLYAIAVYYPVSDIRMQITNNTFSTSEITSIANMNFAIATSSYDLLTYSSLVANNRFYSVTVSLGKPTNVVNNTFLESQDLTERKSSHLSINNRGNNFPSYGYGNYLLNADLYSSVEFENDKMYIRKNVIVDTVLTDAYKIQLDGYGYIEVSDNIVHGNIEEDLTSTGKFFNNIVHDGYSIHLGFYDFYNNISINNRIGLETGWRLRSHNNNIYINNRYALANLSDYEEPFKNSIFIGNEELADSYYIDTMYVENCIIDSTEMASPHGDIINFIGNNNIFIDSTQINDIFEDFENNNFHLMDGSIAIDAGENIIDSTGHFFYSSFDFDNTYRIWDGNENGTATTDIGPYEYNSQQFGTITGQIAEATFGDPVNYVLLKVNNDPGVFEFADSLGYYEIKLPSGTYDLYAERVFYEDKVVSSITVIDGEITDIDFDMVSELVVGIEEENSYQLSIISYQLKQNYPNPFNPTTKICYQLAVSSEQLAEIVVYNVMGQKVWSQNILPATVHSSQLTGSILFDGSQFNSGIYFYSLILDGKTVSTKSMVMIK